MPSKSLRECWWQFEMGDYVFRKTAIVMGFIINFEIIAFISLAFYSLSSVNTVFPIAFMATFFLILPAVFLYFQNRHEKEMQRTMDLLAGKPRKGNSLVDWFNDPMSSI